VQGRPDAAQGGRFLVRNTAIWKKSVRSYGVGTAKLAKDAPRSRFFSGISRLVRGQAVGWKIRQNTNKLFRKTKWALLSRISRAPHPNSTEQITPERGPKTLHHETRDRSEH